MIDNHRSSIHRPGYSKRISDETASEMGIKAFIYKPTVKADLAKTVRKVLDEAKVSAKG